MPLFSNEKTKINNYLEKAIVQIYSVEDIFGKISEAEYKLGTRLLNKAITISDKIQSLIVEVNRGG